MGPEPHSIGAQVQALFDRTPDVPHIPPPALASIARPALFLDFDGTLVDFADHPDGVRFPQRLGALLARLHADLDGALAIVTGRDLETLDRIMRLPQLPVAGVHGLILRNGAGAMTTATVDGGALDRIADTLSDCVASHPGVLVERKSHAVALHYRRAPEKAEICQSAMREALADAEDFIMLSGKFVFEARSKSADKGRAIATFMDHAPFAGGTPVFAGDDVTDEDGFNTVNAMNGISIKIGDGETAARFGLTGPSALETWLAARGAQGVESGIIQR